MPVSFNRTKPVMALLAKFLSSRCPALPAALVAVIKRSSSGAHLVPEAMVITTTAATSLNGPLVYRIFGLRVDF